MNEDEALSALMDGEITDGDVDSLLLAINDNKRLLIKWHRYHVVRSILRKETIALSKLASLNIQLLLPGT
ncbi:MAG: sigma-E factor negative regulatory protein [Pseudomonadales bacterium]|nr:sigma-E factor negative regulatory protein [Pseudomonadales bacterium]